MRYFEFEIELNEEEIKACKHRLNDYAYDNQIEGLVYYVFRTLTNGVTFLIYRAEKSGMKAMFAIDEQTRKPEEALNEILSIFDDLFEKKTVTVEPFEISMIEFDCNLNEAKRRGYLHNWSRISDQANNLLLDDRENIITGRCGFKLDEAVARKGGKGEDHLFDISLREELGRIRAGKKHADKNNSEEIRAFPAHYIISARSKEAGSDITCRLMKELAEAGRLNSGRMELFTDIDCDLYRHSGCFERVVENSHGGTIVIDMTGKFASDPASYKLTCNYLCNCIRQHRNDNLFVFLYDINNPGFTYFLIPQIEKFMYLVQIREGKGNVRDAVDYLKLLIGNSDFSKYAGQAAEFMATIPKDEYTQTDIIKAYESFESWCMRKNLLKSYSLESGEDFFIDRDQDSGSAYDTLRNMIGLKAVKEQIDRVILANKVEKQREKNGGKGRSMHMIFSGNPGTAKTTVAEIYAKIMKETGILKSGILVQRTGMDLNGLFASLRIKQAFEQASGGVLFIDEAYSLTNEVAIATLIGEMEARRNDVIVIFAGYGNRMKEFVERNEGLKSRIPYTVNFPDYTAEELLQIYEYILKQDGYSVTPAARSAALRIFGKAVRIENFGNGRYARNLAENSTLNMSVRLARKYVDKDVPKAQLYRVIKEDVFNPDDPIVNCNEGKETSRGASVQGKTARERLESMIGLSQAKSLINSAVATYKMQKRLSKRGIDIGKNAMHMVFMGNPGTAKTTVARLLAEILKDEGVLSSGIFVEAGRADLVGQYVGQTAPLVRKKFSEANGGVLFIDEAYSLNDGYDRGSFGDEAINTIVQEMDNRRDNIIVIFAGYPDEMKRFVERNPGMSSRIAFRVNFDDYSVDELCAITRYQVAEKHLRITDEAIAKLVPIYEKARSNKTFGNGRYVRRAVELAISNLALRLDKVSDNDLTDEVLTTITADDIAEPELDQDTAKPNRRIGFAA